ncbi:glutathione S-transferase T3-like [Argentina anserina]|uniref:glutathione S-transferase T3-like n=1 Tax=Argentina anserina TaxID=57926 RepID=UPI002176378C|nr:glutathione S-transferase T3-like [Potentilla anserina]
MMDSQYSEEVFESTTKTRGAGFSPEEDALLISAWLNTGMDPTTGNEQKSNTFWGKITDYYHKYKDFDSDRSQQMLKQRWGKIQSIVNKFSGCVASINNLHESGKTEQDKIAGAKSMYEKQVKGKRFTLDHAWILLRHQPKWNQIMQEPNMKKSRKRSKPSTTNISSSSTTSTHIDIEEEMNTCSFVTRPPGTKAEKRKLNETDQLVELQKLHLEKKR